jgi:hypothetical protein
LDYALQEVPRISPFEAAVYWLQINQKLMAYCEGPVCPASYFFQNRERAKNTARPNAQTWHEGKRN